MAEIRHHFNGTLYSGSGDFTQLGGEVFSRGKRALLITNNRESENGHVDRIRGVLEARDVSCLIYRESSSFSSYFSVKEALSLSRGSHSHVILGLGDCGILSMARLTAGLSPGNMGVESLLEGETPGYPSLPLVLIPTTFSQPFVMNHFGILSERELQTLRLCRIPRQEPLVFSDSSLTTYLSSQEVYSQFLEILLIALEGFLFNRDNFMAEEQALAALRILNPFINSPGHLNERSRRDSLVRASLWASLSYGTRGIGAGLALAGSIAHAYGVNRYYISSILLPHLMESSVYGDSTRLNLLDEVLKPDLEITALPLSERIRHLIGILHLPGRLKDFMKDDVSVSGIMETAGRLCGDSSDTLVHNLSTVFERAV